MAGTQAAIPQSNPRQHTLGQSASQAILARIALRLARSIADAADGDQWAMAVVGIDNLGAPDFEEWVSRSWLGCDNAQRHYHFAT